MNPLSIYFILLSLVSKSNIKSRNISSKVGVLKINRTGQTKAKRENQVLTDLGDDMEATLKNSQRDRQT